MTHKTDESATATTVAPSGQTFGASTRQYTTFHPDPEDRAADKRARAWSLALLALYTQADASAETYDSLL